MINLLIFGISLLLGIAAFFTKRRFGVLGLGLSAGVLIAGSWSAAAASLLESQGIGSETISAEAIASIGLTVLPAVILLVGGPKYHKPLSAIIGSVGFAIMVLLFTLSAVDAASVKSQFLHDAVVFMQDHQPGLVALGVAIAVFDVFASQGHHRSKKQKSH